MCGAPKSNNDQNITLKVRFHVISIVYRRNFINTLKILCCGPASRAEIACRFKVSSTSEENNYKITERNTLNLSSALLRDRIYAASTACAPTYPNDYSHFGKAHLYGRGKKKFAQHNSIVIKWTVEGKRVDKAFLLQHFSLPLFASPISIRYESIGILNKIIFQFFAPKIPFRWQIQIPLDGHMHILRIICGLLLV